MTDPFTQGSLLTRLIGKEIKSGMLIADNTETLELKFFGKDEMPQMVNQQHIDMFRDVFAFCGAPFIR